jgi:hypothetical protein
MIIPTRLLVDDERLMLTLLHLANMASDPYFKPNQVLDSSRRPHVLTSSP